MATTTPAIVVSGWTHALGVVRGLGREGVPVDVVSYEPRDFATRSRYVRDVIPAPHPREAEGPFVAALLDVARRTPGALLVPASDAAVGPVARNKAVLEDAGLVVASDEPEIVETLLNKASTLALARSAGVPAPITFTPADEDDVRLFCATATFPAVLKPELSHLYLQQVGEKWTRLEDEDDAVRAYRVARSLGLEVVLQELVPGDDRCGSVYNSYFVDGEPVVEFTSRKIRNSPPQTGSPCAVVSEWMPEVAEQGRRLLAAAKFSGYSCTEFKQDPRDGLHKVMEVNARHNLSSLLATRCGLNFAWMQYRHLVDGVEPRGIAPGEYPQGVHWVDITRDVRTAPHYLRQPGYSLRAFVEPYRRPGVFAVLDRHDPGPAAARAVDTARLAAERIRERVARRRSS
jgi:predicted ATP-grasp superfamily ATP-dependent carboligase